MSKALELAAKEMIANAERYRAWIQQMYEQFCEQIDGVELNGHPRSDCLTI